MTVPTIYDDATQFHGGGQQVNFHVELISRGGGNGIGSNKNKFTEANH